MSDNASRSGAWSSAVLVPVLCAAAVFALTLGVRQSLALYIGPLNTATGLGLAAISLSFAVGQLVWGFTQPIGGAIADKYGSGRVLTVGTLMIATGLALTPFATNSLWLTMTVGVLGAGGAGIAGPAILMSAVSRMIPAERRGIASGLVNAGGSFGQFTILPLAALLIGTVGWQDSLMWLAALSLLVIPLSMKLWLPGTHTDKAAGGEDPGMKSTVRSALRDRSFLLLAAGFFVCGFHVAFIATHLPGVVAACGLPAPVGAWALAVIGLFNIAGSFGIGWAIGRWRAKSLLSILYAVRGVAVLVFMLSPKTELTVLLFAAVIGATYLSTVPPTAGLVGKLYGPRYMATLFGMVMMTHQVGGFLGAWLGGKTFEATGSYDWMWYADILLAVFAALVHLPIREKLVARPVAA